MITNTIHLFNIDLILYFMQSIAGSGRKDLPSLQNWVCFITIRSEDIFLLGTITLVFGTITLLMTL